MLSECLPPFLSVAGSMEWARRQGSCVFQCRYWRQHVFSFEFILQGAVLWQGVHTLDLWVKPLLLELHVEVLCTIASCYAKVYLWIKVACWCSLSPTSPNPVVYNTSDRYHTRLTCAPMMHGRDLIQRAAILFCAIQLLFFFLLFIYNGNYTVSSTAITCNCSSSESRLQELASLVEVYRHVLNKERQKQHELHMLIGKYSSMLNMIEEEEFATARLVEDERRRQMGTEMITWKVFPAVYSNIEPKPSSHSEYCILGTHPPKTRR